MGSSSIEQKDFYQVLNVTRTATVDEIRVAYKEIAKIYHPDSNFYAEIIQDAVSPEDVATFKHITAAYNTLTNPEQRKEYDKSLLQGILPDWDDGQSSPKDHIFASGRDNITRMRNTGFGTVPNRQAEAEPQVVSVSDILGATTNHAFLIHIALGLVAGGFVGLLILFVLGYI